MIAELRFADVTRLTSRGLAPPALLTQWKPAYERGVAMQASLTVLGFLAGVSAWSADGQASLAARGPGSYHELAPHF